MLLKHEVVELFSNMVVYDYREFSAKAKTPNGPDPDKDAVSFFLMSPDGAKAECPLLHARDILELCTILDTYDIQWRTFYQQETYYISVLAQKVKRFRS